MGNNAIFTVLGLIVFFGMINITLNTKDSESTQNVSTYMTNDAARDIAYNALSFARLKVDTSFASISSFGLSGNLLGGTYSVKATAVTFVGGDTIRLSSTGNYQGTSYTVQSNLFHNVKWLPSSYKAAIRFNASPIWSYNMSSSTLVDGNDHDTSGNLIQSPTATGVSDISTFSSTDSANVSYYMTYYYPHYKNYKTMQIDPASNYPSAYIDTLAANADYVYRAQGNTVLYIPNATWGSSSNPVIVYVDASNCYYSDFNGQYTGTGILILRGNSWLPGNLRWNGLVIWYTKTTSYCWMEQDGNTKIVGALYFVGGSGGSEYDMYSNAQVLYSSATLRTARNMAKLNKYFVNPVSQWYE